MSFEVLGAASAARESLQSLLASVSHDAKTSNDFPELDCVRDLVPHGSIDAAEQCARRIGVGADRVLIAAGTIDDEDYARALAEWLGIPFETLASKRRDDCPAADGKLIEAPAAGMLLLHGEDGHVCVVAPHNTRQFILSMRDNPGARANVRLTTAKRLRDFVMRHTASAIAQRAAHALPNTWPLLSAAPHRGRSSFLFATAIGMLALAAAVLAPETTALAVQLSLAIVFLGWVVLRLVGTFIKRPPSAWTLGARDSQLPVYTIIAALYREASSVGRLVQSIRQLDYPPEKLDVKLVIENDDPETREAITALQLPATFEVIVAPPEGPRTKPKALNVALPFAHGEFVVVFDAEDRPEPGQLRRAIDAFATGEYNLACVQAQLTIDNTADGWLAGFFTAEYAGQFDVFLPGLAALRLPLPLGGSSNHFRASVLREVRGWDSYNVTEDADLGMRLARFGYRAGVIDSATYEEAPSRVGPWVRQRTRWFKGWVQTWLVHMRDPRRLRRDLGTPSFVAFQLMVGGNVLAALVHPIFLGFLIYAAASGTPLWSGEGFGVTMLAGLFGTTAVIGYATSAALGCIGLARRGLLSHAWVLLLTPVHWMLLSWAAWRALYQLVRDPYRWEKTEHGLARTSRLAQRNVRSLTALEQLLSHGAGDQRYRRSSAADSSGFRFNENGATKRPSLFIR